MGLIVFDVLPDALSICARLTWDDPVEKHVGDRVPTERKRRRYAMSKEMNNRNLVP